MNKYNVKRIKKTIKIILDDSLTNLIDTIFPNGSFPDMFKEPALFLCKVANRQIF